MQGVQIDHTDVGLPNLALNDATIASLVANAFLVIGGLAVFMFLLAALEYIINNGDQTRIKRAKDTMLYATIGIIVSLSAFTVVQFFLGRLFGN